MTVTVTVTGIHASLRCMATVKITVTISDTIMFTVTVTVPFLII